MSKLEHPGGPRQCTIQSLSDPLVAKSCQERQRRGRMAVVGSGDHDGIDVLGLRVQHPAKVRVGFGLLVGLERLGGAGLVDVAQRHDVLAGGDRGQILRAPAKRVP
jgi:hypothetical protein